MVCIYNTANKYKYKMVSPAVVVVASRCPCRCGGGVLRGPRRPRCCCGGGGVPAAAAAVVVVVAVVVTPLPLPPSPALLWW